MPTYLHHYRLRDTSTFAALKTLALKNRAGGVVHVHIDFASAARLQPREITRRRGTQILLLIRRAKAAAYHRTFHTKTLQDEQVLKTAP